MQRRLASAVAGARSRRRAGSALLIAASTAAAAIAQAGPAAATPAVRAASTGPSAAAVTKPLSAAEAVKLARNATQHVIVFMRDQPAMVAPQSAAGQLRASAIAASQSPLLAEMVKVRATHVLSYQLVNAFAATVSAGEVSRLEANPAVQRVIPDAQITGPQQPSLPAGAVAAQSIQPMRGACLARGKAQLEPEALSVTRTQSANSRAKTARSLGFTGRGVTVAFMADGIDIHNVNFIRSNGKTAFVSYRDFTGDGTNAPTGAGGEAFLDANSIAGQGRHVYNIQHFSAQSPTSPCNIKIEGVAPGVNLVGLKVFGNTDVGTTSGFIAAIQYAASHGVKVLNQSFGNDGLPNVTTLDALDQADEAATKAGVTVVVSSGDTGPFNVIGSPATDSDVISVGASTDFRFYAMTNYAEADMFARQGWLDNNISALSSSGFEADGRTLDMVAPGDLSFASCTGNLKIYPDCVNFLGRKSPIEESGGTSQSSPLTAGAAALVIQAYRKTHHGHSPAPALVKHILLSTATDLGAPAEEQGAGLLNSYKAVQLAASIHTSRGAPKATGDTLLTSVSQLNAVGGTSTPRSWQVTVTNTGSGPQTVRLSGRGFGAAQVVGTGSVRLSNAHSQHFTDYSAAASNYGELQFSVPKGQRRLTAEIAFPGNPANGLNARVRLILIDPRGRFAAHSLPQGIGNFGNVDVINPVAGRWTAVIFSRKSGRAGGTAGLVRFQAATQVAASFGSLSPSSLALPAGGSGVFTFSASTPASAGDAAGSITLNSGHGGTSIPVTLRSFVDAAGNGTFSGTATGGNGRATNAAGNGQIKYYEFTVPAGQPDVSAQVALANDPTDETDGYLVDPDGQVVGYGSNYLATDFDPTSGQFLFTPSRQMNVNADNAIPGTWTLIIVFDTPVVGNELSDTYTGQVSLTSGVQVTDTGGLPRNGTPLTRGQSKNYDIKIENTGSAPEDFFLDARLDSSAVVALPLLNGTSKFPLPLTGADFPAEWVVPTQTTQVHVTAKGSGPVVFTYQPFLGDPLTYVATKKPSASQASSFTANNPPTHPVVPGGWFAVPNETAANGFGTKPAPKGRVNIGVTATTKEFDPAISSSVGDFWLGAVGQGAGFELFQINPGQTGVITVTITPEGPAGLVSGNLYVDDFVPATQDSGSEIHAIPYSYTVSP
jgi:hypothetical protein